MIFRTTRHWLAMCTSAIVLAIIVGCSGSEQSIAESAIENRAPDIIGPATSYSASVRGLEASSADQVTVTGRGVQPRQGPVIDRLNLSLRNVRFQREPFRILNVGEATFSGRVLQDAINTYLRGRTTASTGLSDIRVELRPDTVRVSATVNTPVGAVPVTTAGRLVASGAQVNYEPQELIVGGVSVPQNILPLLASRVNPLVDFTGQRFEPRINEIRVEQGAVQVSGTAIITSFE